jgi:hypothetical protein
MAIYPLHDWKPWLFAARRAPQFRRDIVEQRYYLEAVAQKMGIKEKAEWYNVTQKTLIENNLHHFVQDIYDSNLPLALKSVYPEHPWEGWKFSSRLSRTFTSTDGDSKLS